MVNKVIYDGNTLIDLTADTVDASHLAQGYTAHDKSGATITGTMSGGGGIPEPNPITAGNTPVYSVYETVIATGTTAKTAYSYTVKKAGTYRIKASFTASNKDTTAQIRVNNVSKKGATWTQSGSLSNNFHCDLSVDVSMSVGDVVTCYLLAGSTRRGVEAHAMDVCINWDTGF